MMGLAKFPSRMNSKMKASPCTTWLFPFLYHGSYPTVSSHTGDWSLNPSSHSIAWTIPVISVDSDTKSGSLIFIVGGDDAGAFFPVDVSFVGKGSLAGVNVTNIAKTARGELETFSVDSLLTVDEYLVV
ncbi:hypothetical protein BT96DRAFT_861921 [Gymnopus androsaceus JB14]|uniref:Coatomer subunit delta n=1 Tax=Gymnopus androsaceus JB14 TaxID=1447944 RepID=A0A6A4HAN7_9AGAR|nr:hypothetical protein BT96DRAFT_861921 [Gymnopus androsaceus JB14]